MKSTQVGKYLFKVNNKEPKTKSIETVLVYLLLTLRTYLSEQAPSKYFLISFADKIQRALFPRISIQLRDR